MFVKNRHFGGFLFFGLGKIGLIAGEEQRSYSGKRFRLIGFVNYFQKAHQIRHSACRDENWPVRMILH
ncbi:hypothetical protein [Photobacterium halotolerans]|uniref:hypothetical protein n=1 Tax=Photobacterium halotolerans TaxID=265726 RepID=UPI00041F70A1|nr:hypothetical protein [Photobacterium halotolerans]